MKLYQIANGNLTNTKISPEPCGATFYVNGKIVLPTSSSIASFRLATKVSEFFYV